MSGDIIDLSSRRNEAAAMTEKPRLPTPMLIDQTIRLLRFALDGLESGSRVRRKNAKAQIGLAISELQRILDAGIEDSTRDLAEDLKLALGPMITVGEIAGARRVLALVLTSLPEVPTRRDG